MKTGFLATLILSLLVATTASAAPCVCGDHGESDEVAAGASQPESSEHDCCAGGADADEPVEPEGHDCGHCGQLSCGDWIPDQRGSALVPLASSPDLLGVFVIASMHPIHAPDLTAAGGSRAAPRANERGPTSSQDTYVQNAVLRC